MLTSDTSTCHRLACVPRLRAPPVHPTPVLRPCAAPHTTPSHRYVAWPLMDCEELNRDSFLQQQVLLDARTAVAAAIGTDLASVAVPRVLCGAATAGVSTSPASSPSTDTSASGRRSLLEAHALVVPFSDYDSTDAEQASEIETGDAADASGAVVVGGSFQQATGTPAARTPAAMDAWDVGHVPLRLSSQLADLTADASEPLLLISSTTTTSTTTPDSTPASSPLTPDSSTSDYGDYVAVTEVAEPQPEAHVLFQQQAVASAAGIVAVTAGDRVPPPCAGADCRRRQLRRWRRARMGLGVGTKGRGRGLAAVANPSGVTMEMVVALPVTRGSGVLDQLLQRINEQPTDVSWMFAANSHLVELYGTPAVSSLATEVRTSFFAAACPVRPAVVAYVPAYVRRYEFAVVLQYRAPYPNFTDATCGSNYGWVTGVEVTAA